MRPIEQLVAPITDADGIAKAQQSTVPIDLYLNGVLVNPQEGIARLNNVAQVVELTSAGNLAAVNFTVTGRDDSGRTVSETIAGPSASTVPTTTLFITVESISSDAAIIADVEAGVTAPPTFTTPPVMLNIRPTFNGTKVTQSVEMSLVPVADFTYSVEFTLSDLQDPTVIPVWQLTDNVNLQLKTVTNTGNIFFPVRATRMTVTNYVTGTAKFINIQDS